MTAHLAGLLTLKFFLAFVLYFLAGLRTNVAGHFPIARAAGAALLVTGAGRVLPPDPALLAQVGGPVLFAAVLGLFYRPAWWGFPLVALLGAGIDFAISRVN